MTNKTLPLAALIARSVRPKKYQNFDVLVSSLLAQGYQLDKPIRVNSVFRVVDGVRRVEALRWIQKYDSVMFREILPTGDVHGTYL